MERTGVGGVVSILDDLNLAIAKFKQATGRNPTRLMTGRLGYQQLRAACLTGTMVKQLQEGKPPTIMGMVIEVSDKVPLDNATIWLDGPLLPSDKVKLAPTKRRHRAHDARARGSGY